MTGITIPWAKGVAFGICVLGANSLFQPVAASDDTASSDAAYSCSAVTSQTPADVQQWLVRSMYASHCYAFQARAVSIDAVGVRTLALSHRIHEGIRQQVVQNLDGPSISVERRTLVGQLAWFATDLDPDEWVSQPEAWAEHVESYYDISLENEARVAGRKAVELTFEPHDNQRYYHAWWIDEETGLLLKNVLSDAQGQVLETFQMTQLQSPEPYNGTVAKRTLPQIPNFDWSVNWVPDGFVAQPVDSDESNIEKRLYSDGLAAITLFATRDADSELAAGIHRIGLSSIAVETITHDNQRWQLIGIGELPPAQLQRIVQSIEFN